ncbi:MAG: hypothetical protein INF92_13635 [Rhodobacter sp.]|nr:hypothetical protein [Rhodobacter sp.]
MQPFQEVDQPTGNPFIRHLLTLASALFAFTMHAAAAPPEFRVLREDVRISVFVELPSGPLALSGEGRFRAPDTNSWHMIQQPFAPYPSGDFDPVFAAFHSLYDDRALPAEYKGLSLLGGGGSKDIVQEMGLPDIVTVFGEIAHHKCAGPLGEQSPHVRMFCLISRLNDARQTLVAAPITLETGQVALLVFADDDLLGAVMRFNSCVRTQNGNCPRLPALLLHDTPTLNRLFGSGVTPLTSITGVNQLALNEDGFFDATSLVHPVDLLTPRIAKLLGDDTERDALLFSVTRLDDAGVDGTTRAPGLDFADDALVLFGTGAIEGTDATLLRIPVDRHVDELRAALLPRGIARGSEEDSGQTALVSVAVPDWLYQRLSSVALNAQATDGRFCSGGPGSDRILWRNSPFAALLGGDSVLAIDTAAAPNLARNRLYSENCGPDISTDKDTHLALEPRLASADYTDGLCGTTREGIAPVAGVAGQFWMSPVVDPPPTWDLPFPFVLATPASGTFVQSRPVTLGAFADFLTSFSGCSAFANSEGIAAKMMRCDQNGRFRLKSGADIGNPEFRYYYGAVGDALAKATGKSVAGLTCHDSRAVGPRTEALREADALCALHFYLAARATDRLEDEDKIKATDGAEVAPGGGKPFELAASLLNTQGDVDQENARRFLDFKQCDAGGDFTVPKGAVALCTALQSYVGAAFGKIDDTPWREASVTMVPLSDARDFVAWRATSGTVDKPELAQLGETCTSQLGLANATDLAALTVSDTGLRSTLLPRLMAALSQLPPGKGSYAAAVLAGTSFVPIADRQGTGIAGLPVGFRELTNDGPTARVPAFMDGEKLSAGLGLLPDAVARYFAETEKYNGLCLECRTAPTAFIWPIWNAPDRDDPKTALASETWKRGDPATGFRMVLRLKEDGQ